MGPPPQLLKALTKRSFVCNCPPQNCATARSSQSTNSCTVASKGSAICTRMSVAQESITSPTIWPSRHIIIQVLLNMLKAAATKDLLGANQLAPTLPSPTPTNLAGTVSKLAPHTTKTSASQGLHHSIRHETERWSVGVIVAFGELRIGTQLSATKGIRQ